MKWLFTPIIFLLFCLGCTACAQHVNQYSVDDIPLDSVYNIETGITISRGMTKEAVETFLGKGTLQDSRVLYEDKVVTSSS